eukprot:jgi/Tetstr1/447747/TSEL_035080.t1
MEIPQHAGYAAMAGAIRPPSPHNGVLLLLKAFAVSEAESHQSPLSTNSAGPQHYHQPRHNPLASKKPAPLVPEATLTREQPANVEDMLELNYEEHLNNMAVDDNGVRHNGAAEHHTIRLKQSLLVPPARKDKGEKPAAPAKRKTNKPRCPRR